MCAPTFSSQLGSKRSLFSAIVTWQPKPRNTGKLATNISAANNEKVGRRMNPLQKFIAIDYTGILGSNIIRTRAGGQYDVVRLDFLVLLILIRNPDSMFIDQGSPTKDDPDIEIFQILLKSVGKSNAGCPLRFHPLH
jgi:hypothetical protein